MRRLRRGFGRRRTFWALLSRERWMIVSLLLVRKNMNCRMIDPGRLHSDLPRDRLSPGRL